MNRNVRTWNIPECYRIFKKVRDCCRLFQNSSKMFQKVPENFTTFYNVLNVKFPEVLELQYQIIEILHFEGTAARWRFVVVSSVHRTLNGIQRHLADNVPIDESAIQRKMLAAGPTINKTQMNRQCFHMLRPEQILGIVQAIALTITQWHPLYQRYFSFMLIFIQY